MKVIIREEEKFAFDKGLKIGIFIISLLICFLLALFIFSKSPDISKGGLLSISVAPLLGAVLSILILRLIFPYRGDKNMWSYILGGLSLLMGIASYLAVMFLLGENIKGVEFWYLLSAVIWLVILVWGGLEAPSLLAFILGGVLAGVGCVVFLAIAPQFFFPRLFADPQAIQTQLGMVQTLYGIFGAFAGAIGATAGRASGFSLKDPYIEQEL